MEADFGKLLERSPWCKYQFFQHEVEKVFLHFKVRDEKSVPIPSRRRLVKNDLTRVKHGLFRFHAEALITLISRHHKQITGEHTLVKLLAIRNEQ